MKADGDQVSQPTGMVNLIEGSEDFLGKRPSHREGDFEEGSDALSPLLFSPKPLT
jgi:hypothetical protein